MIACLICRMARGTSPIPATKIGFPLLSVALETTETARQPTSSSGARRNNEGPWRPRMRWGWEGTDRTDGTLLKAAPFASIQFCSDFELLLHQPFPFSIARKCAFLSLTLHFLALENESRLSRPLLALCKGRGNEMPRVLVLCPVLLGQAGH